MCIDSLVGSFSLWEELPEIISQSIVSLLSFSPSLKRSKRRR